MGAAAIGAFDDSTQAGWTRRYITDPMPVECPIMQLETPWANDRRRVNGVAKGVGDPSARGQHARITVVRPPKVVTVRIELTEGQPRWRLRQGLRLGFTRALQQLHRNLVGHRVFFER